MLKSVEPNEVIEACGGLYGIILAVVATLRFCYRMCSLTTECVLLLQNVLHHPRCGCYPPVFFLCMFVVCVYVFRYVCAFVYVCT